MFLNSLCFYWTLCFVMVRGGCIGAHSRQLSRQRIRLCCALDFGLWSIVRPCARTTSAKLALLQTNNASMLPFIARASDSLSFLRTYAFHFHSTYNCSILGSSLMIRDSGSSVSWNCSSTLLSYCRWIKWAQSHLIMQDTRAHYPATCIGRRC